MLIPCARDELYARWRVRDRDQDRSQRKCVTVNVSIMKAPWANSK
jgi:hypothetical protein